MKSQPKQKVDCFLIETLLSGGGGGVVYFLTITLLVQMCNKCTLKAELFKEILALMQTLKGLCLFQKIALFMCEE